MEYNFDGNKGNLLVLFSFESFKNYNPPCNVWKLLINKALIEIHG